MHIHTIRQKTEEKLLRSKLKPFDFSTFSKKETRELIKTMREMMHLANGVGLAANQVGLDIQVFVAKPPEGKFYAIFNPRITKTSKETISMEEGCLSVPGVYGTVPRYEKITLEGQDQNGKKIKIKAIGMLAHVFQHETDHLHGRLYIDKAKQVRKVESSQSF